MLVKQYDGRSHYVGAEKQNIVGHPDEEEISTSYVERQNLTIRTHNRRFARKTNAYSKKIENLIYSVALHFTYYNFCRRHETIRVTPAMEAKLAKYIWNIDEIVALIPGPIYGKRGPYKKKRQSPNLKFGVDIFLHRT